MTDQPLFTLRDIAQETGLPESTIRYYRDAFAQYLPTVGTGRRRRYPPDAVATLRLIALWYQEGRSRESIEHELSGLHPPEIHERPPQARPRSDTRTADEGAAVKLSTPDVLASLLEGERDRRQVMWQMAREMVRLGEAVERQHALLGNITERLAVLTDRALPAGQGSAPAGSPPANGDDGPRRRRDDVKVAPEQLLRELSGLREELAAEKDLVERLRKSKMEIERRVAEAEERAAGPSSPEPGGRRSGVLGRLLSRDE